MSLENSAPRQRGAAIPAVRKVLRRLYWRLERLVVPGLRSSQYAYFETVRACLREQAKWLDVGCGHHVFGDWMVKEQAEVVGRAGLVVGLEYDHSSLRRHPAIVNRVAADLRLPPLKHGSFDLITANMVVEHLENPVEALVEIRRLLKPGGLFVFHTPNLRNWMVWLSSRVSDSWKRLLIRWLEDRGEEDVFPAYYKLNTSGRIKELASRAGFRLLELRQVNTSAASQMLGPLVIPELLLIRLLSPERLRDFRPDIVAVLENPAPSGNSETPAAVG